jgi:hypothetical protein
MSLPGENQSCSARGTKKPGWPNIRVFGALAFCCQAAIDSPSADGPQAGMGGDPLPETVQVFQAVLRCISSDDRGVNRTNRNPATQSGKYSEDASAS